MAFYSEQISIPIGFLYGIVAIVGLAAIAVFAAFYRARRFYEQFDLENDGYEPRKKVNWADSNLQSVVSLSPQPIQPHPTTSLRTKIKESLPWKSNTQQLIDTLKPEAVEEYRGRLNFALSYNQESETLFVNIIQATELPVRDFIGTSDPFVRIWLAEQPSTFQQTKVHSRNLNPKFQQILSLAGNSMKKLSDMTLVMQVMDYDRFSSDDPIGEVMLPMKNVKFEKNPTYWKQLQRPKAFGREHAGEVLLSLVYLPDSNKLNVTLLKAKDLRAREKIGSTVDSYIKLWLVQHGTRLEKRKTTVKPQTLNPNFNELFTFSVPSRDKLEKEINIVLSVMDHDPISSNTEIGHCVLGMLGTPSGIKQWQDILDNPGTSFTMWQKLTRM